MSEQHPQGLTAEANPDSGSVDYVTNKLNISFFSAFQSLYKTFYPYLPFPVLSADYTRSNSAADWMISRGEAMEGDDNVIEKFNNRFVTHYSDGSLHIVVKEDLLPYFAAGKEDAWPNLVLTSTHALVRDHLDISGLMKGFHRLIAHSFVSTELDEEGLSPQQRTAIINQQLPLIRTPSAENAAEDLASGESKKKTILLSAVFTHHNAWVNGGKLLYRLNHLDSLFDRQNDPLTSDVSRAYMRGGDSGHGAMEPHSIRLGKLMLSLIAENPEAIDLDSAHLSDQPIIIRSDAAQILQHVKLAGYSKGGNVVSDAVRELIFELEQHTVSFRQADGTTKSLADSTPEQKETVIRGYIHNIGILCVNPGISPLTDRAKRLGMRRLTIRNENDKITAHLFEKHHRAGNYGTHDDVYVVNGASTELGHGITDALGDADNMGYLLDKTKVKKEDRDTMEEVQSRLQCFFASCVGKVGITGVNYNPSKPNELTIDFSTGVSEEAIGKNGDKIQEAMKNAEVVNPMLSCDLDVNRQCKLSFKVDENATTTFANILEGFKRLRDNGHTEIFVSKLALGQLEKLKNEPPRPIVDASSAQLAVRATTRLVG